jgi:hypothetical protein
VSSQGRDFIDQDGQNCLDVYFSRGLKRRQQPLPNMTINGLQSADNVR